MIYCKYSTLGLDDLSNNNYSEILDEYFKKNSKKPSKQKEYSKDKEKKKDYSKDRERKRSFSD